MHFTWTTNGFWGRGIWWTFRYKNLDGFVCFLPAVSVELIKDITSARNFKGCVPESLSVFFLYLSVTVTANLTSYIFDLHFPTRPLKDHGEISLFSFSRQGNICPEQWCDLQQGQEYAVNPPIHCNMLLQPEPGGWNRCSAPRRGCGVVPRVCMLWPSLGTAVVHRKAERGLHYCPQYPECSRFPFSRIHYKYALIL